MKRTCDHHALFPATPERSVRVRPQDGETRSLTEALYEKVRHTPGLQGAVDIVLLLLRNRPVTDGDSAHCQSAAQLLLELGRPDLLCQLARAQPHHYHLAARTSVQRAHTVGNGRGFWAVQCVARCDVRENAERVNATRSCCTCKGSTHKSSSRHPGRWSRWIGIFCTRSASCTPHAFQCPRSARPLVDGCTFTARKTPTRLPS